MQSEIIRELITRLAVAVDLSGTQEYMNTINRMKQSSEAMAVNFNRAAYGLRNAGANMTAFLAAPLALIGISSLTAAAQIEKVTLQYEIMLKSKEKADRLMGDLREFEAKTPFNLEEVLKFGDSMLRMQVPVEKVTEKLRMLGDAVLGDSQAMRAVLIQLEQMNNLKFATWQDIKVQMVSGRLPMLGAIAQAKGIDPSQVLPMISRRQVSFEDITKAITFISKERMDAMKRQAETLDGRFSTLQSAVFSLRVALGELIEKTLKVKMLIRGFTEGINWLSDKLPKLSEPMKKILIFIGSAVIGLSALTLVLGSFLAVVSGIGLALTFLGKGAGMAAGLAAFGVLTAKILLIVAAIAVFLLILEDLWLFFTDKNADTFTRALLSGLKDVFTNLRDWFMATFFRDTEAKKRWDTYREAIAQSPGVYHKPNYTGALLPPTRNGGLFGDVGKTSNVVVNVMLQNEIPPEQAHRLANAIGDKVGKVITYTE